MRITLAIAAVALISSPAIAEESNGPAPEAKVVELTPKQLDQVTAGDLLLPNDKLQFEGINNPGKDAENFICTDLNMCHPTFNRDLTAIFELLGKLDGNGNQVVGIEGPWAAGRVDNVIECVDCP